VDTAYIVLANSAYTAALPPQLQGTKVVKSMTSTGPSSLNGLSTVRARPQPGLYLKYYQQHRRYSVDLGLHRGEAARQYALWKRSQMRSCACHRWHPSTMAPRDVAGGLVVDW